MSISRVVKYEDNEIDIKDLTFEEIKVIYEALGLISMDNGGREIAHDLRDKMATELL